MQSFESGGVIERGARVMQRAGADYHQQTRIVASQNARDALAGSGNVFNDAICNWVLLRQRGRRHRYRCARCAVRQFCSLLSRKFVFAAAEVPGSDDDHNKPISRKFNRL